MSFGQRLLDALDEKNLTRADLCRMTGLKSAHLVGYIKNPERSPNLNTAVKIADALDVSLDWLSERDGNGGEPGDDGDSKAAGAGSDAEVTIHRYIALGRDDRIVVDGLVDYLTHRPNAIRNTQFEGMGAREGCAQDSEV